jgi:hypothetical protein
MEAGAHGSVLAEESYTVLFSWGDFRANWSGENKSQIGPPLPFQAARWSALLLRILVNPAPATKSIWGPIAICPSGICSLGDSSATGDPTQEARRGSLER